MLKICKIKTQEPIEVDVVTNAVIKKGFSPYIENGYWYEYDNETKQFINTGVKAQGKDGEPGAPGKDGKDGKDGVDGKTPVKGIDYWTEQDKTEIVAETRESLEKELQEMQTDINNLDVEVERLSENVNNIASDVSHIDEKTTVINEAVNKNTSDILEQEQNINHLDDIKANRDELPVLDDYVLKAEQYPFVKDGLVNNNITLTDAEKLKVETWLGLSENYLTTYNTTPYQVETNYNPAHKKYVDDNIKVLDDKVKELELFKFPNMTIVGTPTIQNGQVSNFTLDDYLEFPFLVDFRGRPFEINFAFTTGSNVTVQQNILDSAFGLALAIKNGHTLMAISYNGTTWANQYIGTLNIEPNTTYVYRITWNGILYKVQYYNGSQYVDDFTFASTQQPYPKQMFIGVSKLSNNYFEGTINLNYANLKVNGNVVWSVMDDAGLASRLATDLSNIDSAGIQRIKEIANEVIESGLGGEY